MKTKNKIKEELKKEKKEDRIKSSPLFTILTHDIVTYPYLPVE